MSERITPGRSDARSGRPERGATASRARDLGERGLDRPARASCVTTWSAAPPSRWCCDEPRDRDVVLGEPLARRGRARRAGRRPRRGRRTASAARPAAASSSSRQQASFWRKPVPVVPMTLTMSATTADAVSSPPAPGPSSVISRIASPWSITALNAPLDRGERVVPVDERRPTRTSTAPSTSVAEPTSRTTISSSRAACDVLRRDPLDPLVRDVVERRRASRTRPSRGSPSSPPRRRRRRRRSGRPPRSRAAAPRRAPPSYVCAVLHLREDEVRRPVDDPEHAVDVRRRRATRAAP